MVPSGARSEVLVLAVEFLNLGIDSVMLTQTSILISGGDNKSVNYYNDVVQWIENWCKQSYKCIYECIYRLWKLRNSSLGVNAAEAPRKTWSNVGTAPPSARGHTLVSRINSTLLLMSTLCNSQYYSGSSGSGHQHSIKWHKENRNASCDSITMMMMLIWEVDTDTQNYPPQHWSLPGQFVSLYSHRNYKSAVPPLGDWLHPTITITSR